MKEKILSVFLLVNVLFAVKASAYNSWTKMEGKTAPAKGEHVLMPSEYTLYATDEAGLKASLASLSDDRLSRQIIALPMPDGSVKQFKIWKNGTMAKGLSAKYPDIQTFTATAVENGRISAKIDWTLRGFHAMIYDGGNTSFVDPYSNVQSGYYMAYYRKDYTRPGNETMSCLLDNSTRDPNEIDLSSSVNAERTINGSSLRTYRLAMACTGEYAVAVGGVTPTKASVLSAIVTSVNRVNGVYERELAISLQLIANTDTLIFLADSTDPYTNNNGGTMLGENQTTVTNLIGSGNYDIGHVFSTGGGGIASLGSVCRTSRKAQGVTGLPSPVGDAFDIDFVAHEMGHQFGADHPFNNNIHGSCAGNAAQSSAYEPGSGSTIMAYAGICSPDNIQTHSDAYFHAKSLTDIVTTISNSQVAACPVITISGNKSLTVPAFGASYSIPYKTPFELTAPVALDSVANDEKTYCWEEWNLGDFGARFSATHLAGPIFRSILPDTSRTRTFPVLTRLLANITNYTGEKLPDTARFLTFKLTTRAILNGVGTVNISDDTVHLDVINTGAPFLITTPNTAAASWIGNIGQTVAWNVASTTEPPINCAAVDIFLSTDGGKTYPYLLASGVPNTGNAWVICPNVVTTTARVKVKGTGNVFFDISNANFSIIQGPLTTAIGNVGALAAVNVFPIPATDRLYINNNGVQRLEISLVGLPGQVIWKGISTGNEAISTAGFARGLYLLHLKDLTSGQTLIKKVTFR